MTRHLAFIAASLVAAFASAPAVAEHLVTSISRHQVLVNSNFVGTSIVLFGTIEPDAPNSPARAAGYDLVATVTGPTQTMVERRKERVLGIWTNVGSRTFLDVPVYLAVLTNRPVSEITNADTIRRLELSLADRLLPQQMGNDVADAARNDPFRVNFIRLKTEHQLYVQNDHGIVMLTPKVFRVEIPLPAQAPIGGFAVDVRAFSNGAEVGRGSAGFDITKVGFEQFVADAALDHSLLYGIATAMMAVMTGWFASVVFRRD